MAFGTEPRVAQARVGSLAQVDEGLRQYMLSVYNYMGLGLAITGLVAFVVGIHAGAATCRSSARR